MGAKLSGAFEESKMLAPRGTIGAGMKTIMAACLK